MTTQPQHLARLTPEQKQRQASGNDSAKGRKARKASPWSKGPMCEGPNSKASFNRYCAKSRP